MAAICTDVHGFVEEKRRCKKIIMAEKRQPRYLNLICTFRDPVLGQQRSSRSFFCKIMERNSNTEAFTCGR